MSSCGDIYMLSHHKLLDLETITDCSPLAIQMRLSHQMHTNGDTAHLLVIVCSVITHYHHITMSEGNVSIRYHHKNKKSL